MHIGAKKKKIYLLKNTELIGIIELKNTQMVDRKLLIYL